ncbi:ATP-binding protein [bacterium]|nr:ATP-binding protein [bacterium]
MSIKTKQALSSSILILLTIVGLLAVVFNKLSDDYQKRATNQITNSVEIISSQVSNYFQNINDQMASWTDLTIVKDSYEVDDADGDLQSIIEKIEKNYTFIDEIHCTNANDILIASSNVKTIATSLKAPWYHEIKLSDTNTSKLKTKSFYIAKKVLVDDEFQGYFVIKVKLEGSKKGAFSKLFDNILLFDQLDKMENIVLINKNNDYLFSDSFHLSNKLKNLFEINPSNKNFQIKSTLDSDQVNLIIFQTNKLPFNLQLRGFIYEKRLNKTIYSLLTNLGQISVLFLMFSLFSSYVIAHQSTKKIVKLVDTANEIAKGRYDLQVHLEGNDEISALASSFNSMVKAIRTSINDLDQLNSSLEKEVEIQTESVRNLMNNAGQGFLSFDKEFRLQPEFSEECRTIFGGGISEGMDLVHLLIPDNKDQQNEFKDWMSNAFDNVIDFGVICDLTIKEAKYKDQIYSIEFKQIPCGDHNNIMVILTNVTETIKLQKQIAAEQSYVLMILRVLESKDEFFEFMGEVDSLLQIPLSKLSTRAEFNEYFRQVHTIKGISLMFELSAIAEALHQFESSLLDAKNEDGSYDNSEFDEHNLIIKESFEKTKSYLKEKLGEAIDWKARSIKVPTELAKDTLKILKDRNPEHYQKLVRYVYKDMKTLFSSIPHSVQELASKLGKLIHPVKINGGEFLVDPDPYKKLMQSFIHLFRNAVDHGIEDPEYREGDLGKDAFGTICISLNNKDDKEVEIIIEDDGHGINPEVIKQVLLKKSLKNKDEIENMSPSELLESIFMIGFSSAEVTTSTSGRGVGMEAVQYEIKQMRGTIVINSTLGKGTSFKITIPNPNIL